jgi:hypothetical protein
MMCAVKDSMTAYLCPGFPFLVLNVVFLLIGAWDLPFLPVTTILPQPLVTIPGSAEREW